MIERQFGISCLVTWEFWESRVHTNPRPLNWQAGVFFAASLMELLQSRPPAWLDTNLIFFAFKSVPVDLPATSCSGASGADNRSDRGWAHVSHAAVFNGAFTQQDQRWQPCRWEAAPPLPPLPPLPLYICHLQRLHFANQRFYMPDIFKNPLVPRPSSCPVSPPKKKWGEKKI